MKIKREELWKQVSKAASVANYKDYRGIIKIVVKKDEEDNKYQLNFFGADGINTVLTSLKIDASDANEGEYFIDSKKVAGYLRNLGDYGAEEVEIQFTDVMAIKTEKTMFDFPLENVESYPEIPGVQLDQVEGRKIIVNADSMTFYQKLMNVSQTVASGKAAKPILEYANLEITQDKIDMTTTDGYRLSRITMDCEALDLLSSEPIKEAIKVNLNPTVLTKLITPVKGIEISIIVTKDIVYVVDSEGAITLKSIEQEYPDTRNIMPEVDFSSGKVPFTSIWTVDCKELINAMKLMQSAIVNEKEKKIIFKIANDKKVLASNDSKDKGSISLSGELTGEKIDIKFDLNKLDLLKTNIEKYRICFVGPESPVMVYDAAEAKDFSTVFLVAPTK